MMLKVFGAGHDSMAVVGMHFNADAEEEMLPGLAPAGAWSGHPIRPQNHACLLS